MSRVDPASGAEIGGAPAGRIRFVRLIRGREVLACVGFLAVSYVAFAEAEYERGRSLLQEARAADARREWAEAEDRYTEAMTALGHVAVPAWLSGPLGLGERDRLNAEARRGRGNNSLRGRRPGAAIADLRAAVELVPESAACRLDLAEALLCAAQYDASVDASTEALALERSARAHNDRGAALRLSGRPTEAVPDFMAAIDLDPRYAKAHYNIGLCREMTGSAAEALVAYDLAIMNGLDVADCRFRRGVLRQLAGDARGAVEDFSWVLGRDPAAADARFKRALCELDLDPEAALRDLRVYVERRPSDWLGHFTMGAVHYDAGRHGEAERCLSVALDLHSASADAWALRGSARMSMGQVEIGRMDLSRALALEPSNRIATESMALAHDRR